MKRIKYKYKSIGNNVMTGKRDNSWLIWALLFMVSMSGIVYLAIKYIDKFVK